MYRPGGRLVAAHGVAKAIVLRMPRHSRDIPARPRRIGRRSFLRGSLAVAAAVAAAPLAACDDDGGGSDAGSGASRGGTLRFGTVLPISFGLDPQVERGAGLAIFPRVYGYLLHVDPANDALVYDHAVDVEQPDPTTIIVHLQPSVPFHDLPPINQRSVAASDVVASVERFRDNSLVVDKTWHTSILERVEAVDALTVRFTLKRPYVYSLGEIGAINAGAIIPRELVESFANIAIEPVGSGPFMRESIDVSAGAARVVRNPVYVHGAAYLDTMQWTVYSSRDDMLSAFGARGVDVIPNRDRHEARRLQTASPEIDVSSEPSLAYLSLGMRVDRPPFIDPRVRQAIDILVDRDELIRELAFGDGDILGPVNPRLANGFWSLPRSAIIAARGGARPQDARTADAIALLAAAGAADATFRLQVRDLPDLVDVVALLRNQLARGGMRVEVDPQPELDWFVNFRGGAFEATLISQMPYESPDYPTRFYHSRGIDGTSNMFGFADAGIDALVERSWGEDDRDQRRATLQEAQRLMLDARPMLQLFTGVGYSSAWAYVRNRDRSRLGSMAQYQYQQWLAEGAPAGPQV